MKKISIVLVLTLLVSLFCVPAHANVLGDVSGNGSVDAADARLALRIAVGLEEACKPGSPAYAAADANGSGTVDSADARLILRAAVGLETLEKPEPGKTLTPKEIYKKARAYTFEIQVSTDDYDAIGSGFAISAHEIATNYHVIEQANKIRVFDLDGKEYTVDYVVAVDRDVDVAILHVKEKLTPAELNRTEYETGDVVYTLGSSNGYTGTFSNGVISNAAIEVPEYNEGVTYIQTSAPISGGNSGGPLIDECGRVVGLNTMTDLEGQNLNFAIPVTYVAALDRSDPMTVAQFRQAESNYRKIEGNFPKDPISLRPGALACMWMDVTSKAASTPTVSCSSDQIEVVTFLYQEDGFSELGICLIAKGKCNDAVVTLGVKEDPSLNRTFKVSVTDDADIMYYGDTDVPDFGAVTGVAPKSVSGEGLYYGVVYDGAALRKAYKNKNNVRETYESALYDAGFEFVEKTTVLLTGETEYYYVCEKSYIGVIYTEKTVFGALTSVTVSLVMAF